MNSAALSRFALLVAWFGLSLFGRLLADGFPLPLQNAGTWGKASPIQLADLQQALERSGFLDAITVAGELAHQVGQGKVPAIQDLTGVVEGDVQNRVNQAVAQASDATQLLSVLDLAALQHLFNTLQTTFTTPQEFAFTIPGGRMVFRRELATVSLCGVIAGPGGARITLGMSDAVQLCGNPSERFRNPTREPLVFADISLGLAHVQARRKLLAPPVPGLDPALSIQAAIYFKIHEDWVELRLAGNDPQSLTLKLEFVIGVKAGFSDAIQAEVDGQIILELTVKPTQVATLARDIGDILKRRLGSIHPSSAGAAPELAASVYREIFTYLQTVEDQGELGELAIRFAADGGVGVGIWDTGINAASVGAELTLSVPLESLVALSGDLMATQFKTGLELSTQLVSLFEAMAEGRLNEAELQRQLGTVSLTTGGFAKGLVSSFAGSVQDIDLHVEMGLFALGDIGQVADQTTPLIQVGTDIPVGKILVDGLNGIPRLVQGVSETTKAMVWTAQTAISAGLDSADRLSLGRIVKIPVNPGGYVQRPRGNPPTPPTPAQWEAMAANLLDDVTYSVQFGVFELGGASLGNLVRLAGGANEVTTHLLVGAVRSAIEANDKPFLDALQAAPGQIGNEAKDLLIFNLQTLSVGIKGDLGSSGTIGLEGAIGLGASLGFEARLKASLILLALGHEGYDEEDGTPLVEIDFPLEVSASAGVAVGEGVEISAEGGVTAGQSLATLTLQDWGGGLPAPAGLRVAGFELLEFVGTNRQDGVISGSGWIVLPMGGLVRADQFILDSRGQVLEGQWSGVLELGPFGEVPVAQGRITNEGLSGSDYFELGLNRLKTDFLLRSDGLLLGHTRGRLDLAGVTIEADLRLDEAGFLGSGKTTILGTEFNSTNVRIQPNGTLSGSFSGTLAVDGQLLTIQSLEIRDQTLRGRTTLDVAGRRAMELWLTVDANGVLGTFGSDLELFGAGSANAWVRITDQVEVYGTMDGDFLAQLERQLRGQVLGGIAGASETLRRAQEELNRRKSEVAGLDRDLAALVNQIEDERRKAREVYETSQAAVVAASKEVDGVVDSLNGVRAQFAGAIATAERERDQKNAEFAAAQSEVGRINGQISDLDADYNRRNDAEKAFLWLGYQAARAVLVASRDVAQGVLAGAQAVYNASLNQLNRVRNDLVAAEAPLLATKSLKDQALADARAKADQARRVLEAIAPDPKLDPRYLVLAGSREVALFFLGEAEKLIALSRSTLGEAAGLIEYINRHGEAALVVIDQVTFRTRLANLNLGSAVLIVDAQVAGERRRFIMPYNFKTGQNQESLAVAARSLSPELVLDPAWNVLPWTDDASSGLMSTHTLWAYHFNSVGTALVDSVPVPGLMGTSPAVGGQVSVQGFGAVYSGDANVLTQTSSGSASLAANFLYGANSGTVTFEGLVPGRSYRSTFLSVGWDEAPTTRNITFETPDSRLTVDQNAYGQNRGIRLDHVFTATATTHTVTLKATTGTFHLYALALSVQGEVPARVADWKLTEFGARSFDLTLTHDDADPDGDGLPNLVEYALGSDPLVKNRSAFDLPVAVTLPGSIEGRRFTFPYAAASGDLQYRLLHSSNFGTWSDLFRFDLSTGVVHQLPGVSSEIDAQNRTVTVTITDPNLYRAPSFWRLVVEKP